MIRLALIVVLSVFVGALAPRVQGQSFINKSYIVVDIPGSSPDGLTWVTRPFYFAGWAFNCTGFPPELSVWIYDPNEPLNGGGFVRIRDAQVTTGLYRPDVAAYFDGLSSCNVTPFSGFHIALPTQPPAGAQMLVVKAWSDGGHWNGEGFVTPSAHQTLFMLVR